MTFEASLPTAMVEAWVSRSMALVVLLRRRNSLSSVENSQRLRNTIGQGKDA